MLDNAALPLAMALAAAAATAAYQSREIEGEVYRAVRQAFKAGGADYRAAVAQAMGDGSISRWELTGLQQQLARDGQPFIIDVRTVNLREERVLFAAAARWAARR
ncbi:hypothetical protein [Pseudoduganella chitinolytica]|uniref:Uncharacterized protein n=1 Tax=Pseudoduganella chitinolytica TaxID=34070 RepID=A0ABY8BAT1_9BURK|nr:hypothetical protein [Pseudoduganella chitinolytica]WEF31474.1 hypothetical protein PX653_18675 [Pseudoduganella chitinolytica]